MILNHAAVRNKRPTYRSDIDWSNPLARGLVFAAYPLGGNFYDAISKQVSANFSVNPTTRPTIDGNKANTPEMRGATANFPQYTTQLDQLVGKYSLFAEGSLLTNATSSLVFDSFSSVSGNGLGLKFDDLNLITNGFFLFLQNGNSSASNADVLGLNSENFKHRVMITGDGANVRLYAKNKLDITVVNAVTPLASTTRQTRLLSSGTAALGLALAWNRVLSLDEYQSLFNNPDQLFKSLPRRRYFVVGAFTKNLSGVFSSTDESFAIGAILKGAVNLSGVKNNTDENVNAGLTAFSTPIGGASIKTDEAIGLASMLVAPPPLSGQNISTDEKQNTGNVLVGARALAGASATTDEKTYTGLTNSLPYTALWEEKANTNLGSVKPATAPLGATGYTAVMTAWGGGVFGGGYFMIACNGGHTDYAGNEVYGLPISTYVPVLLRQPTTNAIIAGSSTIEASGLYATAAVGNTPDPQAPRSRHGYSMAQWCSVKSKVALMGAFGEYIAAGQSSVIRYYDPVANDWETGPTILTPFDGAYSATIEDTSGNLWFLGAGSGGRLNRIVPSTGVVTEFGDIFMHAMQSYPRTGVYDSLNNRFWVFGGNGTVMETGYWDLNNLSGNVDFTSVTPTGDTNILLQPAPGAAWFAGDNKIILWSGGTSVTVFDPTTFKAQSISLNSANTVTPTAAQGNGTYGRFRAIGPDSFLGVNSMDGNFFKLLLRGADVSLAGSNSPSDSVTRNGSAANTSVGLSGSFSTPDSDIKPGTALISSQPLLGTVGVTDESTFLGALGLGSRALSGQFAASDMVTAPGGVAASRNIPGANLLTDEAANSGGLSSSTTILGAGNSSDEKTNSGAATVGALALAGNNSRTDEKANTGIASPGSVNLPGAANTTDEKLNTGGVSPATSILGAGCSSDEKLNVGVSTLGATGLLGNGIQTDEKSIAGIAGLGSLNLSGSPNTTDEKQNPGSALASIGLSGQFVLTDDGFRLSTIAMGPLALSAAFIPTDEKSYAGTLGLSLGPQSLSGAYASSDDAARVGTIQPGGISLTGTFARNDERAYSGGLAMIRALQGLSILTDEQANQASIAVGAFNISGQNIRPDEIASLGQVGALRALLGATFASDEKSLSGLFDFATGLAGSNIRPDEKTFVAIVAVGGIALVGQFTNADEYFYLSVVATGQIITKTLRVKGHYSTLLRADGGYATTIKVIGRYENG